MKQNKIGPWQVSAMGIGCMNPSWAGGSALDETLRQESAIPALHAGMDAGITLFDTADMYAPTWDSFGHNELFVAEALRTWSGTQEQKDKVVIATKAGISRQPGEKFGRNGSLDYLLRAAEASAGRLGVEKIQLWQHHRLDPSISFEQQFENVLALKQRGIVDQIGVSNYDAKQLEIAVKIGGTPSEGGVVSIQNEFSPRYRHDLDVLAVCEKYGIAFLPWSPLGGTRAKGEVSGSSAFEQMASKYSASPFAIALAWLMHYSPTVIPIPGATRIDSVEDCAESTEIELSQQDFEYLSQNLPTQIPVSDELTPKPQYR
jgi:aryl-alcohol dehydrogenase-like predicted oxidoreductase